MRERSPPTTYGTATNTTTFSLSADVSNTEREIGRRLPAQVGENPGCLGVGRLFLVPTGADKQDPLEASKQGREGRDFFFLHCPCMAGLRERKEEGGRREGGEGQP